MFLALGSLCCNKNLSLPSNRALNAVLTLADTVTAIALLTLGALIMKGTLFPNNTTAACCLLAFGGLQSTSLIVNLLIGCKGMQQTCCPSKKMQKKQN